MRLAIIGVLIAASAFGHAQVSNQERQGIVDALFLSNLDASDLVRSRGSRGPAWTRTAVNDPLLGVDQLRKLHAAGSSGSLDQFIGLLRTQVYGDSAPREMGPPPNVEVPVSIPESLRPSVRRLAVAILRSNESIREGLKDLTATERRTLIEALPRIAVGTAPVKFEFVRQPLPEAAVIQDLLSRVDLRRIRFAGQTLAQDVQEELPRLREAATTAGLNGVLKANVGGVVVELGGMGDDVHDDTNAVLCIDLGGNDRYTGRYGAGVGYSSVLIDLGGDDTYECPDLSIGAAILGVGLAYDLGGSDRLHGKSLCFGAGIAGVGSFFKDGGDDDYRATALSQGFGFHGLGLLIDSGGEDHYQVGILGQGAGKSGGAGWLIDRAGRDTYRSGGVVNHPYLLETTISFAQGAADGPGALGLLSDFSGIDFYLADSRAQGYGSNEGVGAIMDSVGRDTYSAASEAQGCAIQSGAGYLLDSDGDDVYGLRIGNGHASASNYGVAVLIDQKGNDLYFGGASRPGSASANGTAIFLDVQGDDRYAGPPGVGGAARGSGSIGLFADLGGNDQYADGLANGQGKAESAWGSALDGNGIIPRVELPEPPKPGSKSLPDDAAMEGIYRRAAHDDRAAMDELLAIGEPALRWMLTKKLGQATDAEVGLIGWIALQLGAPAEEICVAAIDLSQVPVARAAILVCQAADFRRAGPRVMDAMQIPGLARVAIRAAGALEVAEAAPALMALAGGQDADLKRLAVTSLGQLGDERSFTLMQPHLESPEPEMRFAAISLLAKFPQRAIPVAKQLIGSPNEKAARASIELLGKIGSPDAIAEVCSALGDPRRGVQIQSLIALDGRVPREFWAAVVELRKSADPLVKAVASRIDLGR